MSSRKQRKPGKRSRQKKRSRQSGPGMGGPTTTVTSSTGGFPARMRVKLCYSQYNPFTLTAAVGVQTFRANSVFDPDFTGTGGQPYNFDDFAIEYKRYRVRACHISVQFINASSGGRGATVVVVPTNSSTTFSSIEDAKCAPNAKWAFLQGVGNATKTSISMKKSTRQILGEDWGDRFEALVTADPSDPWYFQVLSFSNDATTSLGLTIATKLTYDVEFFDRNILTLDFLRNYLRGWEERKASKFELLSVKEATESKSLGPGSGSSIPTPKFALSGMTLSEQVKILRAHGIAP